MKSGIRQNLILITATVISMVLAFVLGINLTMPSVVALEQDARCGLVEHIHRDECYINNVLICGEKAHTHGGNCYLLRLEDNDINRILSEIEADEEKSLEHVITNVVYKASYLELVNEGVLPAPTPTPTPTPTPLIELLPEGSSLETLTATNASVAALNDSIEENNITPALYLNERLISPASEGGTVSNTENIINLTQGQNSPTDLITYAAGNDNANGGISTLAVGDAPSTSNRRINFYFRLDGRNTFVSTASLINSDPDYISYNNLVNAYTSNKVITALSASNIGSKYYIRYNTNRSTSTFTSGATYSNNRVYCANTSSARYAILSTSQYSTTPVNFYTVTLNYDQITGYSGTNPEKYYLESTLPLSRLDLNTEYDWYDAATGGSIVDQSKTISTATTLYARPKQITVKITFLNSDNSTYETKTITSAVGESTVTVEMPNNGNFVWIIQGDDSKCWQPGDTYTTNKDTTFVAVPALYTVTYIDNNGASKETTVGYLGKAKMPSLPDGWVWKNGSSYYSAGEEVTVKSDMTFTAVSGCAVTYIDANGDTTTTVVAKGASHTITRNPGTGYVWMDEDGNRHDVGDTLVVNNNIKLTAVRPINITYNVNFLDIDYKTSDTNLYNKSGGDPAGAEVVGIPVLTTNHDDTLTISNYVDPNALYRVEAVNYREVFYQWNGAASYEYRSVYFLGWNVTVNGETKLYQPGQTLDWDELLEMAGSSGTITFKGEWEDSAWHTASFYVIFNAKAANAGGNFGSGAAEDYTPEVFNTHVFGLPDNFAENGTTLSNYYGITGTTAISSVLADQQIRQLYGSGVTYDFTNDGDANTSSDYNTTLYVLDFPTDEEVLAMMRNLGREGKFVRNNVSMLKADIGDGTNTEQVPYTTSTVNGQIVYDYYNLDTDHYTVRWYVFKSQSDAWHIDGRLIKKVGSITVSKTFGGNKQLIETVKEAAENMTDPFIVAQTTDASKTVNLYFNESANNGADGGYISYNSYTDTYKWTIAGVEADEKWIITENPPSVDNAITLPEWIITDAYNGTAASGNDRDTDEITGVTQSADEITEDWLTADFVNMYHMEDTVLVRKVDGVSMSGLSGATFNLIQRSENGDGNYTYSDMYFIYDSEDGVYKWTDKGASAPGAVKNLTATDSGYLEYSLTGFTYESGDVIVREVVTPDGYAQSPDIILGFTDASHIDSGIVGYGNDADDEKAANGYYAAYQNHVLTVKNYSAGDTTVTAEKLWDCDPSYYTGMAVKVELLANGKVASEVIPGFNDTYGSYDVWLDATGSYTLSGSTKNYTQYAGETETPWQHVWKGLPTMSNGAKIVWTLREVQVGDEVVDATGNFPNWIFSTGSETTVDSDHNQHVYLTVSNTPNRAMIRLTKYDTELTHVIPGAGFKLVQLKNGAETSTVKTATTDSRGRITFDNLLYETWYKLTEETPPGGYYGFEDPVYLKISKTGVVTVSTSIYTVIEHSNAYYPGQANNVHVTNKIYEPLPETGGTGTGIYTLGGLLLMAAATTLLIYRRKRRKEADLLDV